MYALGSVYTKRQCQRCDDACDSVLIETMVSLQNGVATHFQATPLFSMQTELLVPWQSCRGVHADAWCKWALSRKFVAC